ncbi:MAG: methyltransferase [Nitrolancea sp.]
MNHDDHVALLRDGISQQGGVWADFGSGSGAFTLALAELLGPGAEIYSLDLDRRALERQRDEMRRRFPETILHVIVADFTSTQDLPPLDGIVMANSLHYQRDKDGVLRLVSGYLKPGGRLVLIEYNTDRGNHWVPYPLSYPTWETIADRNGFDGTRLLARRPSRFLGEIYSSVTFRSE